MKVRFHPDTQTLTVPEVDGVDYFIDGKKVGAGEYPVEHDIVVTAKPQAGRFFLEGTKAERVIKVDGSSEPDDSDS